jgi:hypothetical protein
MYERSERFPVRGTFAIARRSQWTPLEVLRAFAFQMMMIMSEKTKLDQQASIPEGEPTEQVPDWLAGQLRRMNDQIMEEKLPEDFLVLLRQIENNERKR